VNGLGSGFMKWKYRFLILLILLIAIGATLFLGFPRAASFVFSYRKQCWAAIKAGDVVEFRGFPEFATFEEFGKCDHAQIIKYVLQKQ
jgi:uncharacterized protein YpmS